MQQPTQALAFPTTIGGKTYLNVTAQLIEEGKGWKSKEYFLFRYQMDGERLLLWRMDTDAKKTAIENGKIKGISDHEKSKKAWLRTLRFTDTTENLARFVADAGDSLWDTKEPLRLERVDALPLCRETRRSREAGPCRRRIRLALTDEGKYDESWDAAAEYLKNPLPGDFVKSSMLPEAAGQVKSREVKSKEYRTSLPGAPDGEYVVIQFKTSLENKESAIETVTPMLGKDKKWRVSGYYIR